MPSPGADPRFKEDLDENGREGLDMENEDDMFDDDEVRYLVITPSM